MSRTRPRVSRRRQSGELAELDHLQNKRLRDPAQIAGLWTEAGSVDPRLLDYDVQGDWWELLAACGITLLVTREYEHLVMAIHASGRISYFSLPHPSGMVVDRNRWLVHIASTRNPNQIFDLSPITGVRSRLDGDASHTKNELIPVRVRFLPGCLYIHDLAIISNKLYFNAVGENAVLHLADNGRTERAWWPKCIDAENGPIFGRNHIQLNSIAPGKTLAESYFSASSSKVMRFRPGHLRFPVDKRGVIFSGVTREPILEGLTRPHSARLRRDIVWVANSGYGELGYAEAGHFRPVAQLPGWTRGLCFHGDTAFVGTSRIIPRFRRYAPGLNPESSVCAIHAVDIRTGIIKGSLCWKRGNQIFAIDWLPAEITCGFPWDVARKRPARIKQLFYAFTTELIR